jgi:hypothetical protein
MHDLPSDRDMNPALRQEVTSLRESITEAARRAAALPQRFEARPHETRPAMVISDRETGLEATVGLFAYGAACELLAALFPDPTSKKESL